MEDKFEVGQWVKDATFQVNRGLPVQIIKIEGNLAQVWFPKGEDLIQTEAFVPIKNIR